jgi:hypothetical protein
MNASSTRPPRPRAAGRRAIRANRAIRVIAAIGLLALVACAPYTRGYTHLATGGAEHVGEVCKVGAPVTIRYSEGDAEFMLSLDPGRFSKREPFFVVTARAGVPVSLDDLGIEFVRSKAVPIRLPLAPAGGTRLAEGVLVGTMTGTGSTRYEFTVLGLPQNIGAGRLLLPGVLIGDVALPGRSVDVRRRLHAGVVPLNC